ncbi:hypothetical protein DFH94DRAFT_806969 [Russula ochroleuca]|uniref:Uncharacterized protein n=1 Tax=Russula ochroleuca TaxID=152965 RepID=A0A9P5K085_9AGAM|nr:hypothetical protein DFH94DRAFT_806969 [Russula ochroleuca]
MGPAHNSSSNAVNHKDNQIADLELELAAHASRAAKLHARLMATLDTLDTERHAYAEEISDERRQRVALQAQLRVASAERATIESERDSLREGVLHLIEKVELCNDYSLWPHSSLSMTSLAPPTQPRHPHEQQSQSTWTASSRAYSAALITALREECERERRTHSESLRRIAELEAQLARREAELEEPYYGSTPVNISLVDPPLPQLSRDGAIRVLQQSAARNEAITHEIASLVQKLEDAHADLEKENSPHSSPVMTTPPPPPRIVLNSPPSPVSPTPQRHHSPVPSSSSETSSPILKARRLSTSPSPLVLSPRVASPPADIARQIAAVTQDLAGLRAEEQRLIHTRAQPQQAYAPPVNNNSPTDAASKQTFRRVLLIEEECIRLRAELAASTAREAALREMLEPLPAPVPTPTEEDVFGDDEDDSQPMDLATPLQPTVLLDPEDL